MRKQTALIVDNNMLQHLWQAGGPKVLNSFFRGNRQVVLLSHVKREAFKVHVIHSSCLKLSKICRLCVLIVLFVFGACSDDSQEFIDADLEKAIISGKIIDSRLPPLAPYKSICLFGEKSLKHTKIKNCERTEAPSIALINQEECKLFRLRKQVRILFEYDSECRNLNSKTSMIVIDRYGVNHLLFSD